MTLAQLIERIDQLDADFAIYAAPSWQPSSFAMLLSESDPEKNNDAFLASADVRITYLMQVETARDLIAAERAVHNPSIVELCDLLIYHAIYDAVPPRPSNMGLGEPSSYASLR
jgi:hypothetical protein